MGLDLKLHLLDLDAYRGRVLPAWGAFVDRGDASGVAALLRAAATVLRTEAQLDEISAARLATIRRVLPRNGPPPADLGRAFDEVEEEMARVAPPGPGCMSSEEALEDAAALEGGEASRDPRLAERVRAPIMAAIIEALCFPWKIGFAPELSLRHAALKGLMPDGARWLRDLLNGSGLPVRGSSSRPRTPQRCSLPPISIGSTAR